MQVVQMLEEELLKTERARVKLDETNKIREGEKVCLEAQLDQVLADLEHQDKYLSRDHLEQ